MTNEEETALSEEPLFGDIKSNTPLRFKPDDDTDSRLKSIESAQSVINSKLDEILTLVTKLAGK